jgi:dTDP-4-amino-4,6-dideoxygalactose transaminase
MGIGVDALVPSQDAGPWTLPQSSVTVASGRTALRVIARHVAAQSDGPVLLPSYLCSSMVQPFREESVSVGFYRVRADLSIDLDHLVHLVEAVSPAAVVYVNYFGFPVGRPEEKALLEIRERCWIIEDCAQGSLLETADPIVGRIGDWVLTSFRKYSSLPDGGLLIDRTGLESAQLGPPVASATRYTLLGKLLRHEYVQSGMELSAVEEAYLRLFAAAEDELDAESPLEDMSAISRMLMASVDLPGAMASRRANYVYMMQAFANEAGLRAIGTPLRDSLPPKVSPLVFPIRTAAGRRDALRRELVAQRLFCPVHWRLPREIGAGEFSESHQLSSQILGLPLDQRYDEEDMKTLLDRLIVAWRKLD